MTWVSVVFLGIVTAGHLAYARHPAGYEPVGSGFYVNVVNETVDTVPVGAIARQVDHAIRLLGFVAPADSGMFRVPYHDTWVMLLVGGSWIDLDAGRVDTARVVYTTNWAPK